MVSLADHGPSFFSLVGLQHDATRAEGRALLRGEVGQEHVFRVDRAGKDLDRIEGPHPIGRMEATFRKGCLSPFGMVVIQKEPRLETQGLQGLIETLMPYCVSEG